MLIDWFTVFAQIVNFLVLVWLLKKLLYKPILNAIEKRENLVKSQLTLAEATMKDAQEKSDLLSQEKSDFEKRKQLEFDKAIDSAESIKASLIEDTKKELEALSLKQQVRLKEDEHTFTKDLIKKTQKEVFAIARKALSDLASENLENHIAVKLIQTIETLGQEEREALINALNSSDQGISVRSSLELSNTVKMQISHTFNKILSTEVKLEFDIKPDLVCGIEIVTNGYKLSWNIDEYVSAISNMTSLFSGKSNHV